ncbi:MAG: DUF2294 domain-containing protein [Elainella sp. Prado103]|jgi:uncharacterized protein YbcI|nr:DUF2294 domain-containing protein [Elainella sp. Prado103]
MEKTNEQAIAEQVRELYSDQLGKQPSFILCQQHEGRLIILIEDGLTQPEHLLLNQGQVTLVRQIRDGLHSILQSKIRFIIEDVNQVPVQDFSSAAHLETGQISFVATLAAASTHPDSHDV